MAYCLEGLAQVAGAPDHRAADPRRTVRLFAAAALRAAIGGDEGHAERTRIEHTLEITRSALGQEDSTAAWAAGEENDPGARPGQRRAHRA